MTAGAWVRAAVPGDADVIGAVQSAAYRERYRDVVPPAVLEQAVPEAFAAVWRDALGAAAQEGFRILVAVDEGPVVGFAACGPATDPDVAGQGCGELFSLVVAAQATRRGHGSRLLTAVCDGLAESGFARAVAWVPDADKPLQGFLEGAGWAPDGSVRELSPDGGDGGAVVREVRLHTSLR